MPLHKRIRRTPLLLWMLLLMSGAAIAQKPVQVSVSLIPPYSTRVADYYLGNSPKLNVMLVNHDLTKAALQVRLKMTVRNGSGNVLLQSNEWASYPSIYLDAGVPSTVNMSDLSPYFNANNLNFLGMSRQEYQQGFLKEGIVSFCFEAVEVASRQSVSNEACAQAMLAHSEPPFLNVPLRGAAIQLREPTNIVFQWTPRHLGSPNAPTFNTEYLFQIAELNDKAVNPQSAFESGRPLYEQVTDATALLYGPGEPLLLPGRRYAWRVQVRQKNAGGDGQQFRNGGWSEVSFFNYAGTQQGQTACKAPVYRAHSLVSRAEDLSIPMRSVTFDVFWTGSPAATGYIVEIKAWHSQATVYEFGKDQSQGRVTLRSKPGSPYITGDYFVKIGAKCSGGEVLWSEEKKVHEYKAPPGTNLSGSVAWSFSQDDERVEGAKASLLKPAIRTEESWIKRDYRPGKKQFPLPEEVNVRLEEVTGADGKGRTLIGVSRTIDGKFNFEIPDKYRTGSYTLAVREEGSPLFNGKQAEVLFRYNSRDTTLPPIVLTPKTWRLAAGVVCPQCTDTARLAVDIMIKESDLAATPMLRLAGFGIGSERVPYNGSNYVVLTTTTDANPLRKLVTPSLAYVQFWMRVRYRSTDVKWYPLPSMATSKEDTRLVTQWVEYPKNSIQGRVHNAVKTSLSYGYSRIVLRVPGRSLVPADRRDTVEFTANADRSGNYAFTNMPEVRNGEPLLFKVYSADLRPTPFEFSFKADDNRSTYDFPIANPVMAVVGRLVGPNGNPSSTRIYVDGRYVGGVNWQNGLFLFEIYDSKPKEIKVVGGWERDTTFIFTPRKFDEESGKAGYGEKEWLRLLEQTKPVQEWLKESPYNRFGNGEIFGNGPVPPYMDIKSTQLLRGVAGIPTMNLKRRTGMVRINLLLGGRPVGGLIKISDGTGYKDNPAPSGNITLELPVGNYGAIAASLPGTQEELLPLYSGFTIKPEETITLDMKVATGTRVTGKARDLKKQVALKDVRIAAYGTPYETKTDADGAYSFVVPRDEDLSFEVYRDGFDQIDTAFRFTGKTATINFNLSERDPAMPNVKTLAGFPVNIASIRAGGKDVYEISGTLQLKDNKIFSIKPGGETKSVLTFKKIRVTVDERDRGAAVPGTEVAFEESVLNMQAWGWAPVELGGSGGIRLRAGLKNGQEDWAKGNIGGETLTLLLRTQRKVAGIPIQLPDADLILDNAQSLVLDSTKKFRYAFSASESGIAALHEDAKFRLKFLSADTARVLDKRGLTKDTSKQDARYMEAPVALITSLMIARDTALLTKDGIEMAGYMKFPEVAGMKGGDSSKVRINKFVIGKEFSVKELNFNVGERNPLIVGMQKLQARLTSVIIKDLGTPNLSFGFGGAILLKRADTAANKTAAAPKLGGAATAGRVAPVADTAKANYDEALIIKEFSLTRTPEGNTVTAELKLGTKGIGVKGLTFTTPGESSIKMSYNNAEKSFEFDGSGLISYQKQNAGKAGQQASKGNDSAASSMFPIEIQKFQLRSKDWSMYLAAKADVRINMKVATLHVEKLVVNIGSKVTMQEMNNFLTGDSTKSGNLAQDLAPNEPLDEKTASWAVGVKGGFSFGIKDLKTKAAGSFLLGNVDDKFQIQVNEIEIGITNAAFELAAKVSMAFNDSCAGFQAEAKLTAMKKELEAKFGFYKLYATNSGQKEGIRLFASVKASVAIVTGPIMWHKIGGGFDFNTSSNEYKVRLDGDLGPAGTPKETMVVQNAFVEILFQTDKCGGYPVINGGGELAMNNQVMAQAKIVLDFCTPMVLVEIKTPNPVPIPMVPGMLGKFEGVFYATAKKVNNELVPIIFLYAGVDLSSMGDLLKGDLYFAFGYNYDNNAKDVPVECQTRFTKITDYAKTKSELHAVAIAGSLSINTSNDFDIKLGGLKLGYAKYYFDAGGNVLVAVKLRDGATRAAVGVHVKFGAEVQLLSLNVRGDVALALGLEGGYADLREEGIRDKYAALKEKGIDNFSIDHHNIPELTADRRYKVARLDANASLRVLNPGMQYTDLYGEQWPKLYEPKFSELNGVTVNAANSRMYTEASAGQKFSFLLKRSDTKSTAGYQLRVRYPVGKGPGSQGEKLYVNGTQLIKSARWHNLDANFDDFYYDIPESALNRRDEVRVSFQASATKKMQRIYRTSLFYKSTEDDWYMPHPNEQRPYWDMLENMQRDAKSPDRALRSHYVSKRALDDTANWEVYRTKYEVERPALNGNTVGRWVLEDNRTYATAYAGGSYSFKLKNTTDDTSLVLRVRYWGSDKNKAQTIFINDMMLTRSTVNEDFPGQSFDVDYIIPSKFLASKDLVVKYVADPNTSSPSVIKTILKYDDSYYEKKMLEELSQLKDGAGTKSWYLKGYATFTASLAMNNYPHCNDYCIFCSPRGFKLCLGVSGKFYWRKPDGQSATLEREFSFGSKTQ